jgi:hypothetical protein
MIRSDDDYRRLQLARQRLKGIPDLKFKVNLDEDARRNLRNAALDLYGFIPAWLARQL